MKKLTSLALVLALCLSLAVPALAADAPYTFDNWFKITNVIDHATQEGELYQQEFTCIAPTTITEGEEVYIWVGAAKVSPEDGVTVDNVHSVCHEVFFSSDEPTKKVVAPVQNGSLTLTEPGDYIVYFAEEFGVGFGCLFHVVEPGEPIPTAPTTGPDSANPFTDVKADGWFYDAVLWAVEKEITTGTTATTFSPMQTCTQAQILTFLWRAKGSPEPKNPVPSDTYFAKAAKWAVEQGIVHEFEADVPCTRAMTVEFLWKAAGKPNSSAKPAFTDIEGDGELAKAVAWAVETGVTTGTSETTFTPDQICNRGQIVTFLYRNLK